MREVLTGLSVAWAPRSFFFLTVGLWSGTSEARGGVGGLSVHRPRWLSTAFGDLLRTSRRHLLMSRQALWNSNAVRPMPVARTPDAQRAYVECPGKSTSGAHRNRRPCGKQVPLDGLEELGWALDV